MAFQTTMQIFNTKSSSHCDIRFKPLIYFVLEQTSGLNVRNYHPLRNRPQSNLLRISVTSEISGFELTINIKHEMIGIWQRLQTNFELSGTSN